MNFEVEKKFTVNPNLIDLSKSIEHKIIEQYYLSSDSLCVRGGKIHINNYYFSLPLYMDADYNEIKFIKESLISGKLKPRIRFILNNDRSVSQIFITLKVKLASGVNFELEKELNINYLESIKYAITLFCESYIEKERFVIPYEGNNFEVDFFSGSELVTAEVELNIRDSKLSIENTTEINKYSKTAMMVDDISLPDWIIDDVTGDSRYNNNHLAMKYDK